MDLFVCGNSPLIQPPACPRWQTDVSNACSHVPSGRVDATGTGEKACPLMATSPRLVYSNQSSIEVQALESENLLRLRNDSEQTQTIYCRDRHGRNLEESSIPELNHRFRGEDLQDIWFSGDNAKDEIELLFDDYPRGPISTLGVLTRQGAIYSLKQEPFSIQELTTPASRTPFLHAIFRREWDQDMWPTVVFPEQPHTVYSVPTMADLLSWLRGDMVQVRRVDFPSSITMLYADYIRSQECIALTESGDIYRWTRGKAGTSVTSTIQDGLSTSSGHGSPRSLDDVSSLSRMDIPPVDKVAINETMGAAITQEGVLHVFSRYREPKSGTQIAHLIDLDDATPQHMIPPFRKPQRASINDRKESSNGQQRVFIDVAAGQEHLVALTADGEVFTAGSGFHGALGIGEKQFELDDEDPKCYEWNSYDTVEYSEDWQEISWLLNGPGQKNRKVVKVAAGSESTMLITRSLDCD